MKSIEKITFNKVPEFDELVKHYQPEYISRGGEHLVYIIPNHPDVVVKASTHKITNILSKYFTDTSTPTEAELKTNVEEDYREEIIIKNSDNAQMRSIFGREHTLNEKRFLMKVPISPEILGALYEEDYQQRKMPKAARSITSAWTHSVVQRFSPEAQKPDKLSLSFGAFGEDVISASDREARNKYNEVSKAILFNRQLLNYRDEFLKQQDNSNAAYLSKIIDVASQDEELRICINDFLERSINYTTVSGQILALGGKDNVFFYPDSRKWNYILLDATPIPVEHIFSAAIQLEPKLKNNETLNENEREILKRAVNYVRMINGLSKCLDLDKRLTLPDIFASVDLIKAIQTGIITQEEQHIL